MGIGKIEAINEGLVISFYNDKLFNSDILRLPQNSFMYFFHILMRIFIHIIIITIKIALNDADNFKDTCINTAIDTISATIALH